MKRLTNVTFDIERIVHFYIKTFVHFDIDIYNIDIYTKKRAYHRSFRAKQTRLLILHY